MALHRPGRKPASACASTTPGKRRRTSACLPVAPASPSPIPWVFPVDIVLEIVARLDASTLVRCAALCKSLRRDILSPAFLGRDKPADRIVPPCLLGYLHTYDEENRDEPQSPPALFSLVHPCSAPAAVSFSDKHLAPFLSRSAAGLLGRYKPVTSRGGLVVLRRRNINRRKRSERRSDMCVYDPMSGERTFFPIPPDIRTHCYPQPVEEVYVLLTAADGIDCSFMLLVADFTSFHDSGCTIRAQTISSDSGGTWAPITYASDPGSPWGFLVECRSAVVLHGGVVCWLSTRNKILMYQVTTLTAGSVKLPVTNRDVSQLHLGKSPEGRLRLLVADGFIVSVWLLSPGNAWELKTVMNSEDQLRVLDPEIPPDDVFLHFRSSGERSGTAVLHANGAELIVLDVETGNMRKINVITYGWKYSLLVDVDLPTRLQTMKTFT
ncbi:hypothetical protein QYE76_057981 [Lolium multiflorum]|uniref:F-box domain-containing protein n=1 Tax=Lolium multiflorum TaxID=4521 RepID=A0AAD8T4C2_LOLMU|nr:hypothetical protein QYE76_057981 [Lolium multiflorum]